MKLMLNLYRKHITVEYQNRFCSFATLISFGLILTSLVLPLLVIYKLNGNKLAFSDELSAFEQPIVSFEYKYLLMAESAMESQQKVIICHQNAVGVGREQISGCAKIKISERDLDYDGDTDEMEFTFSFPTSYRYGIKSLQVAIPLNARLKQQCEFQVPAALIIEKIFPANFNDRDIVIKGSLQPNQDLPLICPFFMRNTRTHFFFDKISGNFSDLKVSRIQESLERNPMWFFFEEISSNSQDLNTHQTTVKIILKIPAVPVRHQMSAWQKLNSLWINYLALAVVSWFFINLILGCLFEKRFLASRKKLNKEKSL